MPALIEDTLPRETEQRIVQDSRTKVPCFNLGYSKHETGDLTTRPCIRSDV